MAAAPIAINLSGIVAAKMGTSQFFVDFYASSLVYDEYDELFLIQKSSYR